MTITNQNQNTDITPEEAYTCTTNTPGCRNDELEKIIATDAYWSYEYAVNVIKGRFELAEQVIAKNPELAYDYAVNVIKGQFELGEPAMLEIDDHYRAELLYDYVTKYRHTRWHDAEFHILQSDYCDSYIKFFNIADSDDNLTRLFTANGDPTRNFENGEKW